MAKKERGLFSFANACFSDKIFYVLIGLFLTVFFLLVCYPCWYVIVASFSSGGAIQSGKVTLWPVGFNLMGYETVFNTPKVFIGYRNSLFYTVVGTTINLSMTMLCAYPMSRSDLPGRNIIMLFFSFTMFFGGGLIPSYMLNKSLGFIDSIWVMIIPGAMSVYNMIVCKTFIQANIPNDLLEAAQIDGCNDIKFFLRIVIPLSKAVMAVMVLFYGVGHWNAYFNAMIYLKSANLKPLQIFLKEILLASNIDPATVADPELAVMAAAMAEVIKYALILVAMVPVLIVYPFIQKYFVKGVMIGSIKG